MPTSLATVVACWLGFIATCALGALVAISVLHGTPDPTVLVALTGALSSPVGALAGMVTMQHIAARVAGDVNVTEET